MAAQTQPSLDDLWTQAPYYARHFDPAMVEEYPEPVRRYLTHAIAPHVVLASSVRLRMHGEIRLRKWYSFTADEVISWNTGLLWRADVHRGCFRIKGFDSYTNGHGLMQWKLFGLLPLIRAAGPDIARSAAGRLNAEAVWLPSVLVAPGVHWSASDAHHVRASFRAHDELATLDLVIADDGSVRSFRMPRWGNPDGGEFRVSEFGGVVEEERDFNGYTVPSRLRIGWRPCEGGFDRNGEFFRVELDSAHYR